MPGVREQQGINNRGGVLDQIRTPPAGALLRIAPDATLRSRHDCRTAGRRAPSGRANTRGRVYWGYSRRPFWNDSSAVAASLPSTPGTQADDGVDDGQHRRLAAGHDEVPQAHFLGLEQLDDALVEALVVSADQEQPLVLGEPLRGSLIKRSALRGQENPQGRTCVQGFRPR